MDWLPQSGLAISERRTAWPSNFAPVPCGSTTTTSSMRRCRSEGTSNRVGVARWATMSSTSIRKPRRFAPGSRNSTANTKDGGHHHCPFFLQSRNLSFHQQNLFGIVNLGQFHLDHFIHRGLHISSYEGGIDRNLAMSSVDQDAELHLARTAVRKQRIQCCACGTPGKEYVIDEHNIFFFNLEPDLFFLNDGFWPQRRQVITVKSDIQCSDWDLGVFDSCDDLAQSLSDGYSAPSNSYQP